MLFGFPITCFPFNTAQGKEGPLAVSVLRPSGGESLDSFLLPLSLLKLVGNLEERGRGRVTKYCISYGCWNERVGSRTRTLGLLH